jgi:predicted ABC-type ATPase
MNNFIKKVKIDLLLSKFNQEINLYPGLNIIAGANGSGKTLFLNYIQNNRVNARNVELSDSGNAISFASFSPKRNARRVLIEEAQQIIRQDANVEQ